MDSASDRKAQYLSLRIISNKAFKCLINIRKLNKDMDFSMNSHEQARSLIRNKSIDDGLTNGENRVRRKSPHQPDYNIHRGGDMTSKFIAKKVIINPSDQNLASDRSKSNLSSKMPQQLIDLKNGSVKIQASPSGSLKLPKTYLNA